MRSIKLSVLDGDGMIGFSMCWPACGGSCVFVTRTLHTNVLSSMHARVCCLHQAVVLLDGKPVTDFTFANGIFRTTSPLTWATPSGEAASVHLHLQFSVFAGYGEAGFLSSYLGVQVCVACRLHSPAAFAKAGGDAVRLSRRMRMPNAHADGSGLAHV